VTIRLGQGSSLFQGRVLHLIMSWICPRFGIFWPSTENSHDPFVV